MTESVRAFVAIELPPDVTESLAELTKRVERAGTAGVRTVRPEAMHLTLRFWAPCRRLGWTPFLRRWQSQFGTTAPSR